MTLAAKLLAAVMMLILWAVVTLYLGLFISLLPARYAALEGAGSSLLGLILVLLSLFSYVFCVDRLFQKD